MSSAYLYGDVYFVIPKGKAAEVHQLLKDKKYEWSKFYRDLYTAEEIKRKYIVIPFFSEGEDAFDYGCVSFLDDELSYHWDTDIDEFTTTVSSKYGVRVYGHIIEHTDYEPAVYEPEPSTGVWRSADVGWLLECSVDMNTKLRGVWEEHNKKDRQTRKAIYASYEKNK